MEHWVRLCSLQEAPKSGDVTEFETAGVAVCLASVDGEFFAVDNWCPHRRGPLGQGWLEGKAGVCPVRSWTFDLSTGDAEPPERAKVAVLPGRTQGEEILVDIG